MPGEFLREGRRLILRGLHLLGSRTLVMIGIALAIAAGASAARNLWWWLPGQRQAEGLVVRQLEELSADWRTSLPAPLGTNQGVQTAAAARVYRAVVGFKAGEKSYEVVANARATVQLYPLGSKVDVVYPPGKPERARLKPELPDFWVQAGLLLVATFVGAGSGYIWWKLVRRRAERLRKRRVVKLDA